MMPRVVGANRKASTRLQDWILLWCAFCCFKGVLFVFCFVFVLCVCVCCVLCVCVVCVCVCVCVQILQKYRVEYAHHEELQYEMCIVNKPTTPLKFRFLPRK